MHIIASAGSSTDAGSRCQRPCAKRLNLKPGDTVLFEESEAGTVCIRRAEPLEIEFLSALEGTLSEGNSDNDERAYRDL